MGNENKTTLVFRSNQFKIVGLTFAFLILLQIGKSYFYWGKDNLLWFFVVYLALLAFPVYLLIARNQLTVSSEIIEYSIQGQQHQIGWDEIRRIEINKKGSKAVFFASDGNKRLAISGLNYFKGLESFLISEAQSRHIPIEKAERATYLESKNTIV